MTEDTQMKIRLPRDLKDQVEAAAKANKRTLNGEIVAVLEAFYVAGGVTHESGFDMPAADDGRVAALETRVAALEGALKAVRAEDRSYDHEMRITRLESRS